MAIPASISACLLARGIDYHVVPHPYTDRSVATASAAHVPFEQLAKGVVLVCEDGSAPLHRLAVLPASRVIDTHLLREFLACTVRLAEEVELSHLFPDCAPGAVPALGEPYGLEIVVDTALRLDRDVWFEAGDHRELIRVTGAQFAALVGDARRGHFSLDRTQDEFRR